MRRVRGWPARLCEYHHYLLLPHWLHALRHDLLPATGYPAANRSHSHLLLPIRQHALWNKLPGFVIRSDRYLLLPRRENALRLSMYYADSLRDDQLFLPKREHAFRNILLFASGGGDGKLYLPIRKHPDWHKLPATGNIRSHYLHMRSRNTAFWVKLRFCTSNFQHMG